MSGPIWLVPPAWSGETCFIVGGGVSVETQPVERLHGHKVIALNSSYERVPFADYLLFVDTRWCRVHESRPALRAFAGQLVTCSPHCRARPRRQGKAQPSPWTASVAQKDSCWPSIAKTWLL
jgi:hypothetical protein